MADEKEQGIGGEEVKRNYFWQSTTVTDDDDADAARGAEYAGMLRGASLERRGDMTYLIARDER